MISLRYDVNDHIFHSVMTSMTMTKYSKSKSFRFSR